MKLEDYLEDRKRTEGDSDSDKDKALLYALGMAGETGEVVDQVKKLFYHEHPPEKVRENIVKELGDDFWYRFGLMELLGITLEEVLATNVEKRNERYKDGFSAEASINRKI